MGLTKFSPLTHPYKVRAYASKEDKLGSSVSSHKDQKTAEAKARKMAREAGAERYDDQTLWVVERYEGRE